MTRIKSPSSRLNKIDIRVSDSEKDELERLAREAGFKTVSEYVRAKLGLK